MIRFEEMASLVRNKIDNPAEAEVDRYVGLEHLEPDSLKIRRWGAPTDVEATKLVFASGDIIFGRRRVYQRKLAVADFKGICSAHAMVLRANPAIALPEFLPLFMQSDHFMERALEISVGSLSPTINWKTLAKEKFSIPPLEEQRRVSKVLSAANQNVSCLMDLVDAARATKRSASATLFGNIVSQRSSGGRCLGDIFAHIIDRGHEQLLVLSVTIEGQVVRRESLDRHVSDETGDAKYLRVLPGDLAYNTMRLWQGSVGVAQEEGLVSPAYTILRIRDDALAPEFLLEMLRSPAMQRMYRRYVTGVASDRWRLYFKDLSKIRVNLPDGIKIKQILSDLGSFDQAEARLDSRLLAAREILRAVRREAFVI